MTAPPQPSPPAVGVPTDDWYAGKRIVVMGLGRFGGGLGAIRWLVRRHARVLVTDTADESTLSAPTADLRPLIAAGLVETRFGGHRTADFDDAAMVVVNPAVPKPWANPFVRAAFNGGAKVTTEIALPLARVDPDRLIAVTGTAGKSTTAAMIHHTLRALGREAILGGNIGGSLLDEEESVHRATDIVLELSSVMLWWLGGPTGDTFRARTAVATNFAPNHLDWHGDLDHYRACKQNLVRGQHAGDTAVLGPNVRDWPPAGGVNTARPTQQDAPTPAVPGVHNRLNACLARAAALAHAPDLNPADIDAALATFTGLPHRLRLLRVARGVRFYDDSKSTTPEAAAMAIQSLAEAGCSRIHLIAGGYDKGVDLSPMLDPCAGGDARVYRVYAIGATAPAIAAHLPEDRVEECKTLDAAVALIARHSTEGDAVLLSPGCASWDQFENFQQRGRAFGEAVERTFGGLDSSLDEPA